jgi:drug/metabolite transporter (DMT)-like permease
MNLIQLPLALAGADISFPAKLGAHELPALLGLGVAGVSAHYCLSNAFRVGDASLVVPLDFMRIPLIAVVGWWLYGEALELYVFAGAALIILGLLWNLRSEARASVALEEAGFP